MTFCIKISAANTAKLKPICDATRYHPARLANMLIEYALQHVKLSPTADTVYDIRFWAGSTVPSTHNTMQIFPQLADKASGLRV